MSTQYRTVEPAQQINEEKSQEIAKQLEEYLNPLLICLDAYLDKRLVKTLVQAIAAIVMFRNQEQGLNLSELGSYITKASQAPAGTKRVDRLLISPKWSKEVIDEILLQQADQQKQTMEAAGEQLISIWDGSVIENPSSEQVEGMCAVVSSTAKNLRKSKKGAFNKPGGRPTVVLGVELIGGILLGNSDIPILTNMKRWTRKGEMGSTQREEEEKILEKLAHLWGKTVIHVFDRGYAGAPWLKRLIAYDIQFVIRWKKKHLFYNAKGEKMPLSQMGRGKRSWGHKLLWDFKKRAYVKTGVVAVPVWHGETEKPLWVVIVRQKGEPWYLITDIAIETEEQAWNIVFIYRRRWKIETCFRYEKCELALETIRLMQWEKREKLFLLVTLAYSFLLSLLSDTCKTVREWVLRFYCHRTGKRLRESVVPIYRLRWAISRLWLDFRPNFAFSALQITPKSG
jgi:Transposase DDE domain